MSHESAKTQPTIAKPFRHLTVSYVRKRHEDRKTGRTLRYSRHASLTMNGDWLEQAGFPTGTVVRVWVTRGRLIIEQANAQPPFAPQGGAYAGEQPGHDEGSGPT
ncbi:SymE family type I addiction module toxin [Intestinirhabdus alba]|jgi:toxic protein SymE|uniref:Type I addiction module toxin, SymE family n=1 Tax=Intestinirhabdus alba TaxID=2899544 RepID=A0A6L6IKC1_9ENTR|nr:SymE family type I addiction module toxin [Intestinirhabdus alba]MTH47291.1 type I addiction module toxin, SymE family [Intestinirhabdus alba]